MHIYTVVFNTGTPVSRSSSACVCGAVDKTRLHRLEYQVRLWAFFHSMHLKNFTRELNNCVSLVYVGIVFEPVLAMNIWPGALAVH